METHLHGGQALPPVLHQERDIAGAQQQWDLLYRWCQQSSKEGTPASVGDVGLPGMVQLGSFHSAFEGGSGWCRGRAGAVVHVLGSALSPVAVWTHAELLLCPSWGAAGWGAGSAQGLRTCYGRRPCLKRDPLPRAGVGRVRPLLGEMDEFKAWVRSSPEHGLSLFDPGSVTFPELPDTGTALVRCFAEQKCRWRPGLVLWGGAVVPSAQPSYSTTHLCLHPHSSAAVGPGSAGDPGLVGPAASLHDSQGWVLWVLLCTKGP